MTSIGELIRFERKRQGMTQGDLAKRLDVTSQMVSQWETGLRMPKVNTLIKISGVLCVPIESLVCFEMNIEIYESLSIGDRIKKAREKKGLTQKAVAEMIGVTEPAIRALEIRTNHPRVDTVEKISKVLDVSPAWLCGWETEG